MYSTTFYFSSSKTKQIIGKGVEFILKNPSLTASESIDELVFSIYHSLHISNPTQISIDILIEKTSIKYNIKVYYFDESSEANNLNGFYCIFLNKNQPKQKILYDFALGLAHILGHMNDKRTTFPMYQKWQAEEFAHRFCIPTFMLNHLDLSKMQSEAAVQIITTLFNVEQSVASIRLENWSKNI